MEEAACLAFDTVPSDLQKVFWKITRNDLKVKLRLYLGERYAQALQDYQTLAIVASNALGGGKKSTNDFSEEDIPKTRLEAEMAFKSVFG